MIDTFGPPPPPAAEEYSLLSITSVAPPCSVMFVIVTVIVGELGLAATIPEILSSKLPVATTFAKTTLVHEVFTLASTGPMVVSRLEQFSTSPPEQTRPKKMTRPTT